MASSLCERIFEKLVDQRDVEPYTRKYNNKINRFIK